MFAHESELVAEFLAHPEIVGVEECDERRVRYRDAMIARGCGTAMLGACDRHAVEKGEALASSIRRAVIDDDQLEARVALCENRCDRIVHHRTAVVCRNDHADFGHHTFTRASEYGGAVPRCPRRRSRNIESVRCRAER